MSELTPEQKLIQALDNMRTTFNAIKQVRDEIKVELLSLKESFESIKSIKEKRINNYIKLTKKSTEPNHSWSKEGF
tara:strand:- start:257 stop:484 length:228 start_codon:yes stop_codon:yes gene_type:complete